MPRGGYTQTRSFVYNNEQRVVSATSPDNGTMHYRCNGDGTLARKTDANGNVTATPALALSYDVENRLVEANQEHYGYGPGNQRVWKQWPDGHEEVYFWGPDGRKLGSYRPTESWTGNQQDPHIFVFQTAQNYLYFAGQLVGESAAPQCTEREEGECIHWVLSPVSGIALDRLGSVRARTRPWMQPPYNLLRSSYYPYGEERQTTEQDRDKFATYHRDSTTGLDYANQRYYSSLTGRFLTPDPYQASGGPANPQSWNRYAYVHGDPVNFYDPAGLMASCPPGTHTGPDAMGCVSDNPSTGEGGLSGLGGGSDGMEVVSGGGLDGGGGGEGGGKPMFYAGAYSDLAKEGCWKLLGFASAADAQSSFGKLKFDTTRLGLLQVATDSGGQTSIVRGTPPPAQYLPRTNTIQINSDYNWINFSRVQATNVTTGQQLTIDYLEAINQELGTNMVTWELGNLILLHEFAHSLGLPQESDFINFNKNIYENCIR